MSSHSSSPFLSFVFACWPFFPTLFFLYYFLSLSLFAHSRSCSYTLNKIVSSLLRRLYDVSHHSSEFISRACLTSSYIFNLFAMCFSLAREKSSTRREFSSPRHTQSLSKRQQQESLKNTKCRVIDVLVEENCILKSFSLVQASRAHTRHREIDSVYCSSSYQQKQSSFVLHTEEYNEKKLIALGLLQITYFLITFFLCFTLALSAKIADLSELCAGNEQRQRAARARGVLGGKFRVQSNFIHFFGYCQLFAIYVAEITHATDLSSLVVLSVFGCCWSLLFSKLANSAKGKKWERRFRLSVIVQF